ncbi:hypothetical protein C9Z74_21890, partial [Escherichia coli]
SLWHLCCSEVSISPLFRWPNSVNHFRIKTAKVATLWQRSAYGLTTLADTVRKLVEKPSSAPGRGP